MNFIDKPYRCIHGICAKRPSCPDGKCQGKPAAHQFPDGGPVVDLTRQFKFRLPEYGADWSASGPPDVTPALQVPAYVVRNGNDGMHSSNHNYPYCAAGVCNYYGNCSSRGECVVALASVGKASDDELDDILEGSREMMACETDEQRQTLRKAFFGTKTLDEARKEFEADFDTTQLRDKMNQRKHDLSSGATFGFMWGVPFEVGLQEAATWGVGPSDVTRETRPVLDGTDKAKTERGWERFPEPNWMRDEAPSKLRQPLTILSQDSQERKNTPIASGVLDYFPRALAYVARVSKRGNDIHNPGEPLHWSKHKSTDHADCVARHLLERGTTAPDGLRHSGMLVWRALALLEMELEAAADGISVETLIDNYKTEASIGYWRK